MHVRYIVGICISNNQQTNTTPQYINNKPITIRSINEDYYNYEPDYDVDYSYFGLHVRWNQFQDKSDRYCYRNGYYNY